VQLPAHLLPIPPAVSPFRQAGAQLEAYLSEDEQRIAGADVQVGPRTLTITSLVAARWLYAERAMTTVH
jgi:hypothetical protein